VRIEQLVPTQRVGSEWGLTKSIQNSPTLPAGWSVDALFHALFRGCRLANNSARPRKKVEAASHARRAASTHEGSTASMAFTTALMQQGQCYARAYADVLTYCGGRDTGCATEEAARELRRHFIRAGRAEGRVWGCAGTIFHRPLYSPVSSRRGEALAPGLLEHLQNYLNAVYPTGSFGNADVEDLADVFRTRLYFYETFTSDVSDDYPNPPWSALEPNLAKEAGCNDAGECPNLEALVSCNNGATGLVKIGQARTYHELVPCSLGQECVRRLRDYVPHWAQDIEARPGEDVWLEVLHMGHTAWWGVHAPTNWQEFLDPSCRYNMCRGVGGGGNLWFGIAPGSGIFYHAGNTLVAPAKIHMLARLTEMWVAVPGRDTSSIEMFDEWTTHSPPSFLEKLRSIIDGATCKEAGLNHCYDELYGADGDSWTIMDHYDFLIMDLGRALGYDTLFFTSSFLRPDLQNRNEKAGVAYGSNGEVVDLRRPADWGSAEWKRQSSEAQALSFLRAMEKTHRFTLRDPLDLANGVKAKECKFLGQRPTSILSCTGHISQLISRLDSHGVNSCGLKTDCESGACYHDPLSVGGHVILSHRPPIDEPSAPPPPLPSPLPPPSPLPSPPLPPPKYPPQPLPPKYPAPQSPLSPSPPPPTLSPKLVQLQEDLGWLLQEDVRWVVGGLTILISAGLLLISCCCRRCPSDGGQGLQTDDTQQKQARVLIRRFRQNNKYTRAPTLEGPRGQHSSGGRSRRQRSGHRPSTAKLESVLAPGIA